MKIWPLKIKNAEDVYRINEEGEGGFYPVGANNAWHSGIHISTPADYPITPVLEGTLVAYRINATYHKENITGDITRREYEYLRIEDRTLYEMYTAEEDLIKFLLQNYKLKDQNTPLIHRYPTNFALLQHELKLPGQNDPFYFFTLYTNLRPDNEYQIQDYTNKFASFPDKYKERTPFYREWEFKLSDNGFNQAYRYTGVTDLNNIYPFSCCNIVQEHCLLPAFETLEQIHVEFHNAKGQSVSILQADINLSFQGVTLTPKSGIEAYLYRQNTEDLKSLEENKIAKLRQGATLSLYMDYFKQGWAYQKGLVPVIVRQSCIYEKNVLLTGWIFSEGFDVAYDQDDLKLLKKDGNLKAVDPVFLYQIESYVPGENEEKNYKIVNFKAYLQQKTGSSKISKEEDSFQIEGDFVTAYSPVGEEDEGAEANENVKIVLLKPGHYRFNQFADQKESYGFIKNKKLVTVKEEGQALIDALEEEDEEITVLHLKSQFEFQPAGMPTNIQMNPSDARLKVIDPSAEQQVEGIEDLFTFTEYYVFNDFDSIHLVKEADMDIQNLPQGQLKECNAIPEERREHLESSLIIYDAPGREGEFSEDTGNPKEILDKNTIFEMKSIDSQRIVEEKKRGFYFVATDSSFGYIYLRDRKQLLGKSSPIDTIGEDIHYSDKKLNLQNTIGYAAEDILGENRFSELSLFFKNADILNDIDSQGADALDRYVIPPGEPLYSIENEKVNTISHGFPHSTTFLIIGDPQTALKSTAYKVKVETLGLYIDEDMLPSGVEKNNKYTFKNFDQLAASNVKSLSFWFVNQQIIYSFDGSSITGIQSCPANLRTFAEAFEPIIPNLQGKTMKLDKRGNGGHRFYIDFSKGDFLLGWEFWLKEDEFPTVLTKSADGKRLVMGIGEVIELRCYETSPLENTFQQLKHRPSSLIRTLTLKKPSQGLIDRNSGEIYYLFTEDVSSFYVPSSRADDDTEGGLKKNLLKWSDFFIKNERDTNDDLFCDLKEEIIDTIEEISGEMDGFLGLSPNGRLRTSEIKKLFDPAQRNQENTLAIEYLRKVVCKHPMEWNHSLYDGIKKKLNNWYGPGNCSEDKENYLQNIAAVQDIWNGIKDLEHIDGELNQWFAHPIYFINHLDRCGLFGMNPYQGHTVTSTEDSLNLRPRTMTNIQDCPGFAPITEQNTGYTMDGVHYAKCTTHFNIPRENSAGNPYQHGGIDLAPGEKTPIISFIHGEVWACTWKGSIEEKAGSTGSYGKLMIIKDLDHDLLYLLGHLDDYLKQPNDIIYPGDEVAITGTTGYSTGIHLHLEVRECAEKDILKVLNERANQRYPNAELDWVDKNGKRDTVGPSKINPFDHSEQYCYKFWEHE